ncbi:hypothetical protein [Candidatus Nitronereus thalassa]|uniref:Uncharacterized protein n=1 Tax=Candidatus Nitronereus thalassa TaxID=3020898 RepID=A0ABU3K7C5_9BACT|nr:hypothetical protein [Candidatus Nitronereus thalassa]MDT7042289.1 hypothetical protein [Candidatus Nitronereus thalassa]
MKGRVGWRLVGATFISIPLTFGSAWAQGQNKIADEVSVVVTHGQVIGLGSGSGFIGVRLHAGEPVVFSASKGLNAVAQTPGRLLAFSGPSQRWSVQRLDISENVQTIQVTPRLIFVRTDKRLLGFQGAAGRWKIQELGVQEEHRRTLVQDHLAVVVTDRRVLGFSAFTGGFFAETLSSDEAIEQVDGNDNIIVLFTSARKLVFRSGLAVWGEIP